MNFKHRTDMNFGTILFDRSTPTNGDCFCGTNSHKYIESNFQLVISLHILRVNLQI